MNILLVNPPHPAIGSRIPHEHLPPLGLLGIGGPLLDAGHWVRLVDAEFGPMTTGAIVSEVARYRPNAVLLGHSGSTSAHPVVTEIARAVKAAHPDAWVIYGGVFPTFHSHEIIEREPAIDFIVKGEGEQTIVKLAEVVEDCAKVTRGTKRLSLKDCAGKLTNVPGIVFRAEENGGCRVVDTGMAPLIRDLDACRIAWELIDFSRYSYWGDRRAVVVQFSRGCPHRCQYCGQRDFWRTWRHRDPVKFAAELARLHREHGVEVINFADENPTASREAWRAFLEALIAEKVPLILVGSTRAGDIVRDADILPLYKKAGVARFLLGIESTDEQTLTNIQKGSTQTIDREAIRLLRQHGIISMAAWVADFRDSTDRDYWRALRQIVSYDPDQIQALYATPHWWTPFAAQEAERGVIQPNLSLWDYKHQVLESKHVPSWRVLVWVKLIEAVAQLRPKSLYRLLTHPDRGFQAAMRWYYMIGRQVWPYELWHWLFKDGRVTATQKLAQFWGTWLAGEDRKPHPNQRRSSFSSPEFQPLQPTQDKLQYIPIPEG